PPAPAEPAAPPGAGRTTSPPALPGESPRTEPGANLLPPVVTTPSGAADPSRGPGPVPSGPPESVPAPGAPTNGPPAVPPARGPGAPPSGAPSRPPVAVGASAPDSTPPIPAAAAPSVVLPVAGTTPQVESYDEETYRARPGETFQSISQRHYQSDRYAQA